MIRNAWTVEIDQFRAEVSRLTRMNELLEQLTDSLQQQLEEANDATEAALREIERLTADDQDPDKEDGFAPFPALGAGGDAGGR